MFVLCICIVYGPMTDVSVDLSVYFHCCVYALFLFYGYMISVALMCGLLSANVCCEIDKRAEAVVL